MIGAQPSDIIFTSGGTETNNWVFHIATRYFHETFVSDKKSCLPHIVTSNLEHDSVKVVLQQLEKQGLAEVSFVPASKLSGHVEVEDVISAIRPTTVLVSLMTANNETGVIQPISEICRAVKKLKRLSGETARILLHTDAAQAIGKVKVDADDLGVDYLTIVGHKFYGPRTGALYVHGQRMMSPIFPMIFGGGQELNLRSGTENTAMIAGLGKAAELVHKNLDEYENHYREVRDYLEDQLKLEFGEQVVFNGKFSCSERLPNTCNLSFVGAGLKGHRVLSKTQYIQASIGAACHSQNRPSPILLAIGVPQEIAENAIRLSVGRETTQKDVDVVVKDLKQAVETILQDQWKKKKTQTLIKVNSLSRVIDTLTYYTSRPKHTESGSDESGSVKLQSKFCHLLPDV
ncbi:selenocysteine lyase-like isoform X2 [Gigantopelta aegis]|nr:selenocysteine lyase-like isoform X2 [Gigantopelta aegis]